MFETARVKGVIGVVHLKIHVDFVMLQLVVCQEYSTLKFVGLCADLGDLELSLLSPRLISSMVADPASNLHSSFDAA